MRRKAIGFYWTLPVPWAGFTDLPEDIEGAATASQTIAYQRQVVSQYAKEEGFELIYEKAFIEIEPDRGSEFILEPLAQAAALCRQHDAALLLVDFSEVQGWRSHAPLSEWAERASICIRTIFPSEVMLGGRKLFDPHKHFTTWRRLHRQWMNGKEKRKAEAWTRIKALLAEGATLQGIAARLNAENLVTPTGKAWTKDNIQKFKKTCAELDEL